MLRTIYHIEYAKNGDKAASGGEVCMLENIQYFISQGEKNCILTTKKGKKAFIDWGIQESEFLSFHTIDTEDPNSLIKLLFNYFKRVYLAYKSIKLLKIQDNDIIFCHSDFFPNSIPFYWLYKKNSRSGFFAFVHMLYPSIWKGYEGEFINKYSFPTLGRIYLKLNQFLYFFILDQIQKCKIISINIAYKKTLKRKIQNKSIHYLNIFGGADIPHIEKNEKIYDAIWMGRFHDQKGIQELFDITKKSVARKSDFRVVVIGGGSLEIEENFKSNILKQGLAKNIDYKGFLNGKDRFEIMNQAKVFLMTSYFESYGLVNIEAMKMGLPVIAYSLPVFGVFKKGMIKVPILDNNAFSQEVLQLLDNEEKYNQYSQEAQQFSKDYSWENTGEEIYRIIIK